MPRSADADRSVHGPARRVPRSSARRSSRPSTPSASGRPSPRARRSSASSASSATFVGAAARGGGQLRAPARCTSRCWRPASEPGDEVVTVPLTFVATVAAIRYTGARAGAGRRRSPRPTPSIPERLDGGARPRAPGRSIPGSPLRTVRRHGSRSSSGRGGGSIARDRGRLPRPTAPPTAGGARGRSGDLGCFSFYPGKNLGAYGEGGLVTCASSAELDARGPLCCATGAPGERNRHERVGFNYRMDGIQAAVLRVKLRRLEACDPAAHRDRGALRARPRGLRGASPADLRRRAPDHIYHVYAILRPRAGSRCSKGLRDRGIDARVHYPHAVHEQPGLRRPGLRPGRSSPSPSGSRREARDLAAPVPGPERTLRSIAWSTRCARASGRRDHG